jgi:hypothetical protein
MTRARNLWALGVLLAVIGGLVVGSCCRAPGSKDRELDSLQAIVDAVETCSEEQRLNLLAAGFVAAADENGWKVGTCRDGWDAWSRSSLEMKQVLLAEAVPGCRSMCPGKESDRVKAMEGLGPAAPEQKGPLLVGFCDEFGPEPVFTGEMERLRPQMSIDGFWVFRSAFDETFKRLDKLGGARAEELRARYEALLPWVADALALHQPPFDDNLQVPESTARKQPEVAPTLQIWADRIVLDGEDVLALSDGKVAASDRKDGRITPLFAALDTRAAQVVAEREAAEAAMQLELEMPVEDDGASEAPRVGSAVGKASKKQGKGRRSKTRETAAAKENLDKQIAESAGILGDLGTMGSASLFGTGIMGSIGQPQMDFPGLEVPERDARRLLIQCHGEVPYGLLLDATSMAYEAGFTELQLGVYNPDLGRQATVDASRGIWRLGGGFHDEEPPLQLSVVVNEEGFEVLGNAALLTPERGDRDSRGGEPTIPRLAEAHDYRELTRLIDLIKDEYPDEETVVVAATPRISHDVLIQTLDAVREGGEIVDGRPRLLFPYVCLSSSEDLLDAYRRFGRQQGRGSGHGGGGYGLGIGHGIAPGLGGSSGDKPRAKLGELIVLGALDQSLIQQVIKRHMAQLRYCYQKQLTNDPGLSGKVVIKFVISKDGDVSSADVQSSTMNDSKVEECISGRFMRFVFPEPKGGGIVIVKAPLIFESR